MKKRNIRDNIIKIVLIALLVLSIGSIAYAESPSRLETEVTIQDGGDARVIVTWEGNDSEGTEHVFQIDAEKNNVRNVSVSGNGEEYIMTNDWSGMADTLEDKNNMAGIIEKDGIYNVYWGIGSYGENSYQLSYQIDGMVKSLDDYNTLFFKPYLKNASEPPEFASVTIHMSNKMFDTESVKIWAYGFRGHIGVDIGDVYWDTLGALKSRNFGTILLKMDKNLIQSNYPVSGSFDTYRDELYKTKDIIDKKDVETTGAVTSDGRFRSFFEKAKYFLPLLLIIPVGYLIYRRFRNNRVEDIIDLGVDVEAYRGKYYMEAPYLNKELDDLYYIIYNLELGDSTEDRYPDILEYYLVKWLQNGVLERELAIGSVKFRLVKPPKTESESETRFYRMIASASDTDRIVSEGKLRRWIKRNEVRADVFISRIDIESKVKLNKEEYLKVLGEKTESEFRLTEKGRILTERIITHYNYLLNYSNLVIRNKIDRKSWNECLQYAAVFGILEEMIVQIDQIDPGFSSTSNYDIDTISAIKNLSKAVKNKE